MILFTKFRTGSLDQMRRGSNVVLRKKTTKTESFSKRMTFATKCDQSSPPRARGLHGLGKLITKSAPCAVRTVRRNGGHTTSAITTPQRIVASNFFKVVLANVDIAANAHRFSPPQGACAKHSRVARNGTSDIACCAAILPGRTAT